MKRLVDLLAHSRRHKSLSLLPILRQVVVLTSRFDSPNLIHSTKQLEASNDESLTIPEGAKTGKVCFAFVAGVEASVSGEPGDRPLDDPGGVGPVSRYSRHPSTGQERPPEHDGPRDAVPPRPSTTAVTQNAVVLLADLLSLRGRPLRCYLEAAFTEMAR